MIVSRRRRRPLSRRILFLHIFWPILVAVTYCTATYVLPLIMFSSLPLQRALASVGDLPQGAVIPDAAGAWCWFADPRALTIGGYTAVGYVSASGDVTVTELNHGTGESATAVLYPRFERDDHDNPAFLRRASDGRILAFYARHLGTTIYMQEARDPDRANAWGPPRALDETLVGWSGGGRYTYPTPMQLAGEPEKIWLYFRAHDSGDTARWAFITSPDGGDTWSTPTALVSLTYLKVRATGPHRIDFTASEHPVSGGSPVYHFYSEQGRYYRSNGEEITAPLPLTPADLTPVTPEGTTGWIWDLAATDEGDPVILYTAFSTPDDHRYRLARWTGDLNAWDTTELARGGGTFATDLEAQPGMRYYSGGGSIAPGSNGRAVYLSEQAVNDSLNDSFPGGRFEIVRYDWTDGGWQRDAITSGSWVDNLRPYAVDGTGSGPEVIWLRGWYASYTRYNLSLYAA